MAKFDHIAANNGDREWFSWYKKAIDARLEIAQFVDERLKATTNGEPEFYRGSFNCCLRVKFQDRTPMPLSDFPNLATQFWGRKDCKRG
jgi:hypothetical protein